MKLLRRLIVGCAAAFILSGLLAWSWLVMAQPVPQSRAEIYRGVYLTVEDWPKSAEGDGKVMIVEVHWDTPGIRFQNRPFDYPIDANDADSPHYKLAFADFALRRSGAAVLMNTNLYFPAEWSRSWPGRPVRAVETIVVDGQVSHVHEHSYLMYWDALQEAHMVQTKPPDPESLASAEIGLGLQGIQVRDGAAVPAAIDSSSEMFARNFIGIDPEKRILFLIAVENTTAYGLIERAVQAGVIHGGPLDSGSATHLLIGPNADGVRAYSGIRNARPLGPYLTIYADPL